MVRDALPGVVEDGRQHRNRKPDGIPESQLGCDGVPPREVVATKIMASSAMLLKGTLSGFRLAGRAPLHAPLNELVRYYVGLDSIWDVEHKNEVLPQMLYPHGDGACKSLLGYPMMTSESCFVGEIVALENCLRNLRFQ